MKFLREFKFRAINFRPTGFHTHLSSAHTIVRENNIRHLICNSIYTFQICHVRSTIGYDKLVMMHKMLNGQCHEKLKIDLHADTLVLPMFAIHAPPEVKYFLHIEFSCSKMQEIIDSRQLFVQLGCTKI